MIRLCGATLGLLAFAVTIFLGLAAGNSPEAVITRAVWALFVFCFIGLVTGWVAHRVLDEHAMRRHREMFPEENESGGPTAEPNAEGTGEPAAG